MSSNQLTFSQGWDAAIENTKIMSIPVMITREQADIIVVNDLIQKYAHNLNSEKWAAAFRAVISYYLDEQETEIIDEAIKSNTLPKSPLDLLSSKTR